MTRVGRVERGVLSIDRDSCLARTLLITQARLGESAFGAQQAFGTSWSRRRPPHAIFFMMLYYHIIPFM